MARRGSARKPNSGLWLAIAAGLAAVAGGAGRRAAARGAASGFAFAAAIGRDQPWLGLPLRFLAAAVAYSRVHTGVHYPGDIVIGSLIGEGTGQAVAGLIDRLPPSRWSSRSGRDKQQELPEAADAEGLPG
jgi:hypothetical protein